MSHELIRLTSSLRSQPLLITPAGLEGVMDYLSMRNNSEIDLKIEGGRKPERERLRYVEETRVGVIEVSGPLSYQPYQPLCGPEQASYQGIQAEFDKLVEVGAKTIVFDLDTPGGQAYGVFETSRRCREIADKHGIKLIGYVDGVAYSAGYAILSAMHEKIGNPDSGVGSIGVLVHLANMNRHRKEAGIDDVYVYAGDKKIPFKPDGGFKEDFINKVSSSVHRTYERFVNHVSELTGLDKEIIVKTQADYYDAEEGLKIGLLDATMTRDEFFSHLADVANNEESKPMSLFGRETKKEEDNKTMSADNQELNTLREQVATAEAENKNLKEELEATKELNAQLADTLASLKKDVADLSDYKKKAEKEAADNKVKTRKETLAKVLPEDKVEAMYNSTEALSDEAFDTVVSSLKAVSEKEEESDEFTEKGITGEAAGSELDAKLGLVGKLIENNKTNK